MVNFLGNNTISFTGDIQAHIECTGCFHRQELVASQEQAHPKEPLVFVVFKSENGYLGAEIEIVINSPISFPYSSSWMEQSLK